MLNEMEIVGVKWFFFAFLKKFHLLMSNLQMCLFCTDRWSAYNNSIESLLFCSIDQLQHYYYQWVLTSKWFIVNAQIVINWFRNVQQCSLIRKFLFNLFEQTHFGWNANRTEHYWVGFNVLWYTVFHIESGKQKKEIIFSNLCK